MAKRKVIDERRKPRNVTLSPALVKRLIALGTRRGEKRLSVLLDEAMRLYLDTYDNHSK